MKKTKLLNLCHVLDYIQCLFSKNAGGYETIYIEKEVGFIASQPVVDFKIRPVIFEKGDTIPELPNCRTIPNREWMETDIVKRLLYDKNRHVLYILRGRVYGKDNSQVSLIDIERRKKKAKRNFTMFLNELAKQEGPNAKLRRTINKEPIKYSEVPCSSTDNTPSFWIID